MFRLFSVILILSFCKAPVFCMTMWKDMSTERQIELAFDVTPMTIHTFIKWLDYFTYVLEPTYTYYHIPKGKSRCCICSWHCKKDGIFLPIWNFCTVSMFLQVMQHLSPQPLHCPISDLLVDMSALIKRSFKLLGLKWVCYDGVIISDICWKYFISSIPV
jgi:hypothetical protein